MVSEKIKTNKYYKGQKDNIRSQHSYNFQVMVVISLVFFFFNMFPFIILILIFPAIFFVTKFGSRGKSFEEGS